MSHTSQSDGSTSTFVSNKRLISFKSWFQLFDSVWNLFLIEGLLQNSFMLYNMTSSLTKTLFCKTNTSWYQGVVPLAPKFSHKRIGILLCDKYNISKKKLALSGLSCFHFVSKSENVFKFRLCHQCSHIIHFFHFAITLLAITLPSLCHHFVYKMKKWKKWTRQFHQFHWWARWLSLCRQSEQVKKIICVMRRSTFTVDWSNNWDRL